MEDIEAAILVAAVVVVVMSAIKMRRRLRLLSPAQRRHDRAMRLRKVRITYGIPLLLLVVIVVGEYVTSRMNH